MRHLNPASKIQMTESLDPTRYPWVDRSIHLLLLTSQLDDGAIDIPLKVCTRQMLIHIHGIRPVF